MGELAMFDEKHYQSYFLWMQKYPQWFVNQPDGIKIILDERSIQQIEQIASQRLHTKGHPSLWGRVGVVYEDPYLLILRDAVQFPDGEVGTYIRILHPQGEVSGVAILPVCNGNIVLLRHFRHATRNWHLEIPRGFGSPLLSAEDSASRELWEEIQANTQQLLPLGSLYTDTGITNNKVELFLAYIEQVGSPSHGEGIQECLSLSLETLEEMIGQNQISDSFTIAAYTRSRLKGLL